MTNLVGEMESDVHEAAGGQARYGFDRVAWMLATMDDETEPYKPLWDPDDCAGSRRPEQLILEGAHGGLLCRLGVVPAADVEGAVGREEAQLVGGGPAHVAGLAAAAGLGLLGRPLD